VRREVLSGSGFPGEGAIRHAIEQGCPSLWAQPVNMLDLPDLDEGEAACLRIAAAYPGDSLVLMDERAGRALAAELGLKVTGTAAIIGMARRRGLIGSARAAFERLHQSDFRISVEVIQTVLASVGE
jgi:predicted nucleic acid-binding protein